MSDQIATEWFDQFPVDELASRGVMGSDQWCIRHWAPAPVFGANGIAATLMLINLAVKNPIPLADVPAILNRSTGAEPLCCRLGDQVVFDVWGKCPPTGYATRQADGP
jgi:hypothetical protein